MSVSIVIPAYNAAPWLPDALNSVLRQSYQDWEAIVVSDGSADETDEVVEGYCEQDGRIRLLKMLVNHGAAHARNRGMLEARGEYIAFLDADDIWFPSKLEKQLLLLEAQPDCDACYTQFEVVNDWARVIQTWRDLRRTFWHNPVNAEALARANYVSGSASGVLMRRSVIPSVGLFNERMRGSEDFDYWYRLALQGHFCLVPEVLVQIRRKSETRLSSARRNLLGSLDFVHNARLIAPARHWRMLRELEIESKLLLWGFRIGSTRILRRARIPELLLLGKQNHLLKRTFKSLIKLGGLKANPALRERRIFE